MLINPWDTILTVVFAITGLNCLWHVSYVDRSVQTLTDRMIDILHLSMSVAMIVMIWIPTRGAGTWLQVAVFAGFGLLLVISAFAKAIGPVARVNLLSHSMLASAMVWMLAAMPLMMAGVLLPTIGTAGGQEGHSMPVVTTSDISEITVTPIWVALITWFLVALCAIVLIWWSFRFAVDRRHRRHTLCHIGMSAGMGIMLALMVG